LGIIRKSSYNIGVARLIVKHKYSDPLSKENIENIFLLLNNELNELLIDCKKLNVETLIGSSGSYETFANLIKHEFPLCHISDSDSANNLNIENFLHIYDKLISYNESERTQMPGMEIIRVKMIPVAAVITKFLLKKLNIKTFIQSNFSIKEGTLFDYIDKFDDTD
jgi:exopolyphosphatase/guanosine-5'-triphosphate,3'-diphosphate pyrophosphatase